MDYSGAMLGGTGGESNAFGRKVPAIGLSSYYLRQLLLGEQK